MKRAVGFLAVLLLSGLPESAFAVTHYVSPGGNNTSPYTNWLTAATNIQAAVNVATNGETVLLTNGTYGVASRIWITNAVSVLSVNSYLSTTVACSNVRAFNLDHSNATIEGLAVVNGRDGPGGGGAYVDRGTIRDCWFVGCVATGNGGGAVYIWMTGLVERCRFSGNSSGNGGGALFARFSTIRDCVFENNTTSNSTGGGGATAIASAFERCWFVGNRADWAAGALLVTSSSSVRNCVFTGNVCEPGGHCGGVRASSGTTVENCTIVSNSAPDVGGLDASGDSAVRNCIIFGNSAAGANTNYLGLPGATITYSCVPELPAGDGNFGGDPLLTSIGSTNVRLRLGSPCIDRGTNVAWMNSATDKDGNPRITGSRVDVGAYEIPYVYVSRAGSNTPPYETWAKAATNIQAAVDAFENHFYVFVTNGTYTSTGQISVAKVINMSSVNGADVTTISGGGTHRCLSVTSNAIIQGFTFTNGYLGFGAGNGAGLYCDGGATVRQCRITGNYALDYGGGVFFGGGGALEDSVVVGNVADVHQAGGIYCRAGNTIRNCLITTNVSNEAGGVLCYQGGLLENCTIVGNASRVVAGGGVRFYQGTGVVRNCIVYFNSALVSPNMSYQGTDGTVDYTCTTPAYAGVNNITNDPAFPSPGDYRLSAGSACVNVGTNQPWMTNAVDIEGYPRIIDSVVDLGAYECTPVHHVSKNGTNAWPFLSLAGGSTSVQAGIDAAWAGDVVYVGTGTYAEAATITIPAGCDIELSGVAGADSTILDGHGARRILSALADSLAIHGFTFKNGASGGTGGALTMSGATGTVFDCNFVSNSAGGQGWGCRCQLPRGFQQLPLCLEQRLLGRRWAERQFGRTGRCRGLHVRRECCRSRRRRWPLLGGWVRVGRSLHIQAEPGGGGWWGIQGVVLSAQFNRRQQLRRGGRRRRSVAWPRGDGELHGRREQCDRRARRRVVGVGLRGPQLDRCRQHRVELLEHRRIPLS